MFLFATKIIFEFRDCQDHHVSFRRLRWSEKNNSIFLQHGTDLIELNNTYKHNVTFLG